MSKIILAICIVTISAVSANFELFGEWTPVAMYPIINPEVKGCYTMLFAASDEKCSCADGKNTQVVNVSAVNPEVRHREGHFPFLAHVIENFDEVASSLQVTCTFEGGQSSERVLIRPVNEKYFVMYKHQDIVEDEPLGAVLYAKEITSLEKLQDAVKNIEDLRDRTGQILCTSETVTAVKSANKAVFFP